jgi:hypothetical protein
MGLVLFSLKRYNDPNWAEVLNVKTSLHGKLVFLGNN